MKILHYLSGLPPVRGGGMIKYALDLLEAESKLHEVILLVPGAIAQKKDKRGQVAIKKAGMWKNIHKYQIINPLPIPMANGIQDIEWYIMSCDLNVYRDYLHTIEPDIIHVHTLMGLHEQFLHAACELHIPVVYTTHDYFGICPKVDLIYHDEVCEKVGEHCAECSKYAFSEKRLLLEQSKAYELYRKSDLLIDFLRKGVLAKAFGGIRSQNPVQAESREDAQGAKECVVPETSSSEHYKVLADYYKRMYNCVSGFHFNSSISRQVYEQHLGPLKGEIISISNSSIRDRRYAQKPTEQDSKLKVGFLGGDAPYKGLKRLQKVMNELYSAGETEIELHVYGSLEHVNYPFVQYHAAFRTEELPKVFESMDVLAVPSSWMETFGMVVLEAISCGTPVIITEKVGAKDVLGQADDTIGLIIQDSDQALKEIIRDLYHNREKLEIMRENIIRADIEIDFDNHVAKMIAFYNSCMGERGEGLCDEVQKGC